jgi:hypothetical protein
MTAGTFTYDGGHFYISLDTYQVYGGQLTALVAYAHRPDDDLQQVPAQRRWCVPADGVGGSQAKPTDISPNCAKVEGRPEQRLADGSSRRRRSAQ